MRKSLISLVVVFLSSSPPTTDQKQPGPIPKDTLPTTLTWSKSPLGLDELKAPADNPLTEARVALGRRLFFDPILSANQTVACASCHHPDHGFASTDANPRGIFGQAARRRAPSLFNRAYGKAFFWDGRAQSLEEQALKPIVDPREMGSTLENVITKLKRDPVYPNLFKAAFDDGISSQNLAKALAGFQRTILRFDQPIDRLRHMGEHKAMSPAERAGLWIYESKGKCWRCHSGMNFSDEKFHNTGIGWGGTDLGRYEITKLDADKGRFKTPTLRGSKLAAPYMHDGSLNTLEEVVEFYNRGGNRNPQLDRTIEPLNLSAQESSDLIAFLKSL